MLAVWNPPAFPKNPSLRTHFPRQAKLSDPNPARTRLPEKEVARPRFLDSAKGLSRYDLTYRRYNGFGDWKHPRPSKVSSQTEKFIPTPNAGTNAPKPAGHLGGAGLFT